MVEQWIRSASFHPSFHSSIIPFRHILPSFGMLEYWNGGTMDQKRILPSIIPLFHHSIPAHPSILPSFRSNIPFHPSSHLNSFHIHQEPLVLRRSGIGVHYRRAQIVDQGARDSAHESPVNGQAHLVNSAPVDGQAA